MSEVMFRLLLFGVLIVAAALGIKSLVEKHDRHRDNVLTGQANTRTEAAADSIDAFGDKKIEEGLKDESGLDKARSKSDADYGRMYREDKKFSDIASIDMPDGLRNIARERREERERLESLSREDGRASKAP